MRWAILVGVAVFGLASEAAAQGPSITVNLDGNSQVLPLVSSSPATSPPHPPGSRCYFYRAIVGGLEWQVNVGAGPRIDQMQFRVMGKAINALASSPFIPVAGGSGTMKANTDGPQAAAFNNLPVTITP